MRPPSFILYLSSYISRASARGMTFIELIVWMALLGMISVSVLGMVMFFYRSDRDLITATSGSQSVRKTVDRLVKDLREATFAHNGAYLISAMSPYSMTFYSDIDKDDPSERVRYYVSGTTLFRGIVNATGNPPAYPSGSEVVTMISSRIVNQSTSSAMFRYYNDVGTEITDMSRTGDVRFIEIRALVDRAPTNMAPQITEIKASVSLRNPPSI